MGLHNKKLLAILIIIISVEVVSAIIWWSTNQTNKISKPLSISPTAPASNQNPTQESVATTTSTAETANGQTYVNEKYGFQLKNIPNDWFVQILNPLFFCQEFEENNPATKIYNCEYSVNFSPSQRYLALTFNIYKPKANLTNLRFLSSPDSCDSKEDIVFAGVNAIKCTKGKNESTIFQNNGFIYGISNHLITTSTSKIISTFKFINKSKFSPEITVLSPNQRKTQLLGSSHIIQWTTNNVPSDNLITIGLRPFNAGLINNEDIILSESPNTGSKEITIPLDYSKLKTDQIATNNGGTTQVGVDAYWLFVRTKVGDNIVEDFSDDMVIVTPH